MCCSSCTFTCCSSCVALHADSRVALHVLLFMQIHVLLFMQIHMLLFMQIHVLLFAAKMHGCVHGLPESEVVTTRDTVWAMTYKQQLLAHFAAIYSHDTHQFTHTICGKPVCLEAWLFATNISKSRYYEIRGNFLDGYLGNDSPPHTRFIVATEMAMQWLQVYANENGDKLPNAKKILLPSSVTKCLVYDQYAEEYKGSGYAVSRSTFFKHWESTCSHITIPKVFNVALYVTIHFKNTQNVYMHISLNKDLKVKVTTQYYMQLCDASTATKLLCSNTT